MKEYQVYDFNGIVGSVGGSMGLFVGASVLDLLLSALRVIFNKTSCLAPIKYS